jgi:hypothetical protein
MHTGGTPGGGQGKTAGGISNLEASNVTRTSFVVSWNAATGATGYSWAVTQMNGKKVKSGSGMSRRITVTGLHPGFTYNFGVQALPGGSGNNIHVTTHK